MIGYLENIQDFVSREGIGSYYRRETFLKEGELTFTLLMDKEDHKRIHDLFIYYWGDRDVVVIKSIAGLRYINFIVRSNRTRDKIIRYVKSKIFRR